VARQITLELLADSGKFESGMKNASRAAETGAEQIEQAAKKADRMSDALDRTGTAADASESKFMGLSDVASGVGDLFGIEALGGIAAFGLGMADLTGGFAQLAPVMTGVMDNIKNLSVVTKAQSAAQAALNLVMSLNPIFLVVAAVVALVAIFVVAYKNCETFRDIVDGAFNTVKNVVMGVYNWVKDNWPLLLAILTGPIGLAVLAITTHWDTIKNAFTGVKNWIKERIDDVVGFFTGLGGRIAGVTGGMWDGIKNAFRGAVNAIVDFWNGLEFRIPGFKVGPIGFDGFTLGVPNIPRMAQGGFAAAGSPYIIGEAGPELFVPRTSGTIVPSGAAGAPVIIYLSTLDPAGAGPLVVRALDEYESRNGARYARA
jgi:phage-related protein